MNNAQNEVIVNNVMPTPQSTGIKRWALIAGRMVQTVNGNYVSHHDAQRLAQAQRTVADESNNESQLASAVALLKSIKSNLMHQRRFGQDTLQGYRTACTNAEGDIEQWLIDNGHLHTEA